MEFVLEANGLHCECEKEFPVFYEDVVVGQQALDAIVERTVVLEYKGEHWLKPIHEAQLLSYLKASGIEVTRQYRQVLPSPFSAVRLTVN